ncbi:uncharacterized protein LOC143480701 isoform X2 [Brachyhypopomus gauderio]|uniref:uncharacterized protein LOC143480701 isoform X2 n=1 Tax=Brachyhypopomus gauderio TaxID=698409 RepID=UPI0040421785
MSFDLDSSMVDFKVSRNSRKFTEISVDGQHLSIHELRSQMNSNKHIGNPKMLHYLNKNIPDYPTPVEFHVANVAHVTEEMPLRGILGSEKFKPPNSEFSWWDLKISDDEINSAEQRYLEKNRPNEAADYRERQEPFLNKFTTSPLFQTHTSRYGNYRFTFPLAELMDWYKVQNCEGEEPVLRVFKTITYKQEIVYAVLVHSPKNDEQFKHLPYLEKSEFICYLDGEIIWKAQAIAETHSYEYSSGKLDDLQYNVFYVWDQVSVVFHLPSHDHINITRERLIKALEACEINDNNNLTRYEITTNPEELLRSLKKEVEDLKEESEEDMKPDVEY